MISDIAFDMEVYDVAQLFIQASRNEEISPALYNGAMLIQSSGWNTRKYFKKYYAKDASFPIVITMNHTEGIYYYHFSQAQKHAEEIFTGYWKNPDILRQRFEIFHNLDNQISVIYDRITRSRIKCNQEDALRDDAIAIRDAAWDMNAALFFSIVFDEQLCLKLLGQVRSAITPDRVRSLWEKATQPISQSFDIRRRHMALNMLMHGASWEEMGERCQFFEAHYDRVKDPSEVISDLKKDFGGYSSELIKVSLDRDSDVAKKRRQEYAQWIKTLSAEEVKLVEYIQAIIKLRDVRKDPMARAVTIMHRFAQKIFTECAIEEKYIPYAHFHEVLEGSRYVDSIRHVLQSRLPEYAAFVDNDGNISDATGAHESTKKQLNDFYLQQQFSETDSGNVITGSTGSPGNIQGRVRVISSYQAQKDSFQENEILVSGMTRPEFVPLMQKASAIITDEGGITSHAAIISRELKIPCIIGTKIATQVLKDGDLVEVDADKGMVKIIGRA